MNRCVMKTITNYLIIETRLPIQLKCNDIQLAVEESTKIRYIQMCRFDYTAE